MLIADLNINSSRKDFEFLIPLIKYSIDVLMISETKLDENFPVNQFMINGFSAPFSLDQNDKGFGFIPCTREDIPSRLVSTELVKLKVFI